MLTFSEALVQLKVGDDLKHKGWAAGQFLRATTGIDNLPKLVRVPAGYPTTLTAIKALPAYSVPQNELFSQDWSKA